MAREYRRGDRPDPDFQRTDSQTVGTGAIAGLANACRHLQRCPDPLPVVQWRGHVAVTRPVGTVDSKISPQHVSKNFAG